MSTLRRRERRWHGRGRRRRVGLVPARLLPAVTVLTIALGVAVERLVA